MSSLDAKAKALDSAVSAGHQQLVSDVSTAYQRSLIARRAIVVVSGCNKIVDPRLKEPTDEEARAPVSREPATTASRAPRQPCGVYLPADNGKPFRDRSPIVPELADAVKALTDYTAGLAAVTNAKDRADYDSAVSDLASTVSSLVSEAGGVGAAAGAAVKAGINLLGWIVGTALDIQRFNTLKAAVNEMNTPVRKGKPFNVVVMAIAQQVRTLAQQRRELLQDDITALKASLGPQISEETYRLRLADVNAMSAALDALNQSSVSEAANALMLAHLQLVLAVNSSNPNIQNLTNTLKALGDKASALQTALSTASSAKPASSHNKGS
ncbi:MAG: hypothetical protein HYX37_13625 [Rhizobiales bacterium]|nr:hypothetical protein [Hyphomicrobiales bacterium]